ncbi:hypothetical protein NUU61_003102 [Penicillium alfredii]|uniref:ABM domain-containing protein n=1 Tax=Penicillium alfredii TaxID=1506179 RepID=A0A9W9FTG2_9EURO|nr:uncharacterized protein NUU61_003102 [Penicillium alfredii]KAJ5105755.1 hypothetical protein NUU61_003102 [Penicillium alfredii]
MAITELALLRLKSQDTFTTIKPVLQDAQKAQSEYSGHAVRFFRQTEDPLCIYLTGGWASVATHNGEWTTLETNQQLLARLVEHVDMEWMFHLDIDPSTATIPLNAPIIAISRYFVDRNKKAEFEEAYEAGIPGLGEYTAPFPYCGSWRIDKDGENDEFVLFSGWNSVEHHMEFTRSEAIAKLRGILGALTGMEVAHVQKQSLE